MTKIYFLGGENIVTRNSKEINASAFRDAGGAPAVLVFPWARASFDKSYQRRKRLTDYFRSLDACAVDFAEYSDPTETIAEKTENSDLIYLTGGLTNVLLERLRNKNVDSLLRGYDRVIVGRSAGALALCKKCVVTERSQHLTKIVPGLNLVDFTIKVHYHPQKDKLLRKLSKEERIYAIPARSALVYDNGDLSFMGEVYLFQNGEKSLIQNCQ